jgi:hypothetical protein
MDQVLWESESAGDRTQHHGDVHVDMMFLLPLPPPLLHLIHRQMMMEWIVMHRRLLVGAKSVRD